MSSRLVRSSPGAAPRLHWASLSSCQGPPGGKGGAGCRRGAQPGPGRGCRRPGGSQAALPPVADAGVPSSADSRLRLRPGRGERVPKMAASWAWRQAGLPRRSGRESKAAPAAPHLPCCVAPRVPSAAQSGPGLAAGTPALHPFWSRVFRFCPSLCVRRLSTEGTKRWTARTRSIREE